MTTGSTQPLPSARPNPRALGLLGVGLPFQGIVGFVFLVIGDTVPPSTPWTFASGHLLLPFGILDVAGGIIAYIWVVRPARKGNFRTTRTASLVASIASFASLNVWSGFCYLGWFAFVRRTRDATQ